MTTQLALAAQRTVFSKHLFVHFLNLLALGF